MRSDDGSARWEFKTVDLLDKLRENRTAHVKEFNEAVEGYMKELEETLARMLAKVQEGKDIDIYIKLTKPSSHEKDYDRIIDVLEMTPSETVRLTLGEFDKYVRDNWEWTESFKMSTSRYYS